MCIISFWTQPRFDELNELLARAKKLDEALGLKNCEDPIKLEVLRRIEEHLARLNERVAVIEAKQSPAPTRPKKSKRRK